MNKNEFTIQEQMIREFGKEISKTVKYWKPVSSQLGTCLVCGEKHYHIISHIMKNHSEGSFSKPLTD